MENNKNKKIKIEKQQWIDAAKQTKQILENKRLVQSARVDFENQNKNLTTGSESIHANDKYQTTVNVVTEEEKNGP